MYKVLYCFTFSRENVSHREEPVSKQNAQNFELSIHQCGLRMIGEALNPKGTKIEEGAAADAADRE